jgi:hypothetical protein
VLARFVWLACLACLASPAAPFACSASQDNCTCLVENNGQRRTLACDEIACVGGITIACRGQGQSEQRGACTDAPPAPPASTDPDSGASAPPPDPSCDDLRTFCSVSCATPASESADCQSTASAGDPAACAQWQAANGVLCGR